MPSQATIAEDTGSVMFCVEVVTLGAGFSSNVVFILDTQEVLGIPEAGELIM